MTEITLTHSDARATIALLQSRFAQENPCRLNECQQLGAGRNDDLTVPDLLKHAALRGVTTTIDNSLKKIHQV